MTSMFHLTLTFEHQSFCPALGISGIVFLGKRRVGAEDM
jgi:hypothetical protein